MLKENDFHKKRFSAKEDIKKFEGWDFIRKWGECAEIGRGKQGKRLIYTTFLTGGRISEVIGKEIRENGEKEILSLRGEDIRFDLNPDLVVVQAMPVLKGKKKKGEVKKWQCKNHCNMTWDEKPTPEEFKRHDIETYDGEITERKKKDRTFSFPKIEPKNKDWNLVDEIKEWLQNREGRLFDFGYWTAYRIVKNSSKRLLDREDKWFPPHALRGFRASQLSVEYGFGVRDLMEWFKWENVKEAETYASMGYEELGNKMLEA
jgi:hypothetical protein